MKKYNVTGMSCAACQARVEKAVSELKNVESCSVSLLTNSMGVEGTASDEEIIEAVERAGYGASVFGADNKENSNTTQAMENALRDKESPVLVKRLISSAIFLVILMYYSMGHMMWHWPVIFPIFENHVALAVFEMLIAIIIMVINKKFFINGFKSLCAGSPNMDSLVALGSGASFIYSLVVLFIMIDAMGKVDSDTLMKQSMNLYFESAAMIPTLITIGKLLEAKSKGRTTDAIKSLISLSPKEAVILENGKEISVLTQDVKKDDIYILKAGSVVPVDGIVIEGTSAVNESMLTGESIPVEKAAGDSVSAGTVNTNGYLKCKATRVGEDTTLSEIIRMVSDAAATKAPIARIADKVSAVFIPVVIVIAVITFIGWIISGADTGFAIARAISVLVISCPCALGLATPVAIMVGNGVGAKNGILYKTAESLETAGRTGVVVIDKTGTITKGEPEVADIIPGEGVTEDELISYAYAIEKKSEHPLARAIVNYYESSDITFNKKNISISDFEIMPGAGVKGIISDSGEVLLGGSYKYLKDIINLKEVKEKVNERAAEGKTPLLFMKKDRYLGIITVADQIKEDSKDAINEFRKMGIYSVMLTGDNAITARSIAEKVGVDRCIAGVMPDDKAEVVAHLQEVMSTNKKIKIAMVGDGINDAPALTKADIGFAIGAGTDVAVDAADIVLMKNSIRDVSAAIRMSRATIKNIHENLFWAFFYNALCIPFAMGLYGVSLKPMYGAAAMACSSLFVCLNALRLNLFKLYASSKDRPVSGLKKSEYKNMISDIIDDITNEINDKNEGDNTMKKTLHVEGMMCEHCEATVQKALEAIEGVKSAKASHKKGTVVVKLDNETSDDILKNAVEEKDYKVISID
ncbi:MAG: heavy metal translocating P-type ATPase [Eubacterium sp.]|nr:heavy metal translocating P-type ATPase [Eubacterium sp.]